MPADTIKIGNGFGVHVVVICRCGWLMRDSESGTYCVNPGCLLKTKLYSIWVEVEEIKIPQGAVA
jgi:hypothetical protein